MPQKLFGPLLRPCPLFTQAFDLLVDYGLLVHYTWTIH